MDVAGSVREFVKAHVVLQQEDEIGSDESLLDSGLLDSAGLFELVSFLEERFGITIDDEELVPDNFETIDAIVAFVNPKVEARAAGGEARA